MGIAGSYYPQAAALVPADRARRFPIQLTLRYRPKGEENWQTGSTLDLSHTGVLFEAQQPLPVNTPLEMRLLVRFEDGQEDAKAPEIVCYGRVARQADGGTTMAASLFAYRFRSAEEVSALAHHLAQGGLVN